MAFLSVLLLAPLLLQLAATQAIYTRTTTVTFVTCPTSTYSFTTDIPSISASATSTCANPTICPGCQTQQYVTGDGNSYQVQCNRTFSGNVIPDSVNTGGAQKRSIQPSIQACLASCDDTSDCVAAVLTGQTCTLYSSIDGTAQFPGAEAGVRSAYAATNPAILNLALSSPSSSLSGTPFSEQLSDYISGQISDSSPLSTSQDTIVFITTSTTSSSLPFSTGTVPYSSQLSEYLSSQLSENSPQSTSPDTIVFITSTTASTSSGTQTTASGQASSSGAGVSSIPETPGSSSSTLTQAQSSSVSLSSSIGLSQTPSTPGSTSPTSSIMFESAGSQSNPASSLSTSVSSSLSTSGLGLSSSSALGTSSTSSSTASSQRSSSSSAQPSSSTSTSSTASSTSTSLTRSSSISSSSTSISLSSSSTSSSTSTTATSPTPIPNNGKRGLAFNQANLTQPYSLSGQNSRVSWSYNWFYQACPNDQPTCGYNPAIQHIPLLYSNAADLLTAWPTAAQTAINAGAPALMSFNEPDVCFPGSACMTLNASVATYQQYMQPFAGRALLGAPAVTNAGPPAGLTYLADFLAACTGCTVDFVNIHWYANKFAGAAYFESFVNQTRAVAAGRPIWVTEFALSNENPYSQAELQAFLQQVMPWMDQQIDVARYAYFMNAPGILIDAAGSGLSGTGVVYNNFTNATVQPDLF